jgi:hypothetical protein
METDNLARTAVVCLKMLGLALLLLGVFSNTAQAQIPPSVIPFLDLKCYGITDADGLPLPPLNVLLHLDHLNPIFRELAHPEDVFVLDPFQLCVPVAKAGVIPPPDALAFIQYIDLKCYNMQTDPTPLALPIFLRHLNPVLRELQVEFVTVQDPQKLCVPVAKTFPDGTEAIPPATVLPSVQYIDQKCYGITNVDGFPLPPINFPVHLDHLNPVFMQSPLAPPEDMLMLEPQQLCVPVAKNQQFPPPQDFPVISQIDLKCYGIVDQTTGLPGPPLNMPQSLYHLNPVLLSTPGLLNPEIVVVQEPQQLCVPVQKSLQPPAPVAAQTRRHKSKSGKSSSGLRSGFRSHGN